MKNLLYDWLGLNQSLLRLITTYKNYPYLVEISYFLDKAFHFLTFPIYFGLLLIAYYFHWNKKHKQNNPNSIYNKFSKDSDVIFEVGINYILFVLVFMSLKHIVNFPRPICVESLNQAGHIIYKLKNIKCYYSFPSAHSGIVMLILLQLIKNRANITATVATLITLIITGLSRVMLMMHYPADVVYGCIISFGVFWLSGKIYRLFLNQFAESLKPLIFRWLKLNTTTTNTTNTIG